VQRGSRRFTVDHPIATHVHEQDTDRAGPGSVPLPGAVVQRPHTTAATPGECK